jgi:DNA invertase Pin-like site-specific DNA recombinase
MAPMEVVAYARVSTDEQARSGYSIAHQEEALRAWCAENGHELLEVVRDEGHSGAYLERQGLDRVRDLVEAGGVSLVVAQDADRLTREPGHRALLDEEFERFGTRMMALDDWGDAPTRDNGENPSGLYTLTPERIRHLPEEEVGAKRLAAEAARDARFRELYALLDLRVAVHTNGDLDVTVGTTNTKEVMPWNEPGSPSTTSTPT